jgi:hypothetical protein
MEHVAAFFGIVSLQVLERVDRSDFAQVFGQPYDTAFRLAILYIVDEFGNLILAE